MNDVSPVTNDKVMNAISKVKDNPTSEKEGISLAIFEHSTILWSENVMFDISYHAYSIHTYTQPLNYHGLHEYVII